MIDFWIGFKIGVLAPPTMLVCWVLTPDLVTEVWESMMNEVTR